MDRIPVGNAIVSFYSEHDVRVVHDRRIEGLFYRADWLDAFHRAGLHAKSELDEWGRDVFISRKP